MTDWPRVPAMADWPRAVTAAELFEEARVRYKFAILAATAFYGPALQRSFGRPLLERSKKAHALAHALPEPDRTVVLNEFEKLHELNITILTKVHEVENETA